MQLTNSPLVFLSYYLRKSIFHLCCLGQPFWAMILNSYMIALLSLLHLSGLVVTPLPVCWLYLLLPPLIPCPGILKSWFCLPVQPLANSYFLYISKQTEGRDLSAPPADSPEFWGPN